MLSFFKPFFQEKLINSDICLNKMTTQITILNTSIQKCSEIETTLASNISRISEEIIKIHNILCFINKTATELDTSLKTLIEGVGIHCQEYQVDIDQITLLRSNIKPLFLSLKSNIHLISKSIETIDFEIRNNKDCIVSILNAATMIQTNINKMGIKMIRISSRRHLNIKYFQLANLLELIVNKVTCINILSQNNLNSIGELRESIKKIRYLL